MKIEFFVPGIPRTAGSKRAFVITPKGGGRPRAIVTDSNTKGKDWRSDIRAALSSVRPPIESPLDCPLSLSVAFVMPRPKSPPLIPSSRYYWPRFPCAKLSILRLS